jgi:activator of HSP90 ATPase
VDPQRWSIVSGAAGGAFTIYGGYIIGRNIELAPNQRVVQAWRVANWDPGVYSIVKFELLEHDGGTKIVFDHTGFPGDQGQHFADGWNANYWEPMRKLLG